MHVHTKCLQVTITLPTLLSFGSWFQLSSQLWCNMLQSMFSYNSHYPAILFSFSLVGFTHQPWPATGCIRSLVKLPKPKKKKNWLALFCTTLFISDVPFLYFLTVKPNRELEHNQVSFDFSYPGNIAGKEHEQRWQIFLVFWEFLANKQGRFCDPLKKSLTLSSHDSVTD